MVARKRQVTKKDVRSKQKKVIPEEAPKDDVKSSEFDNDSSNSDTDENSDSSRKSVTDSSSSESSSDESSKSDDSSSEESDRDKKYEDESEDEKGQFFTDENAAWLKPKVQKKQQLMPDGDDEDEDDDEDELLEVERQAREVDQEMMLQQQEAQDDYQETIARDTAIFELPTREELDLEKERVVPPSELKARIEAILEVLADFKTRRSPRSGRSDYIQQLICDMAELYGYLPELLQYIIEMLGPTEAYEYAISSEQTRPLVIRTNTLKTRRKDLALKLIKRGVSLDPLSSWSKVGLLVSSSTVPMGATPEYLAGHYMLQSAASQCPVLALDAQTNERILDVSAAPGGKTSYIAQMMQNTGTLVANDLKAERQKATAANLHRLGVKNVVTCQFDGRALGAKFPNRFDRVLLDAPCSGLGVVSRDPSVKVQRTIADIQRSAHLQKEILVSAIDALHCSNSKNKPGILVYSTCSIAIAENEEVVNYALSKRDIKIVDAGLEFGKPGFTRFQSKRFHPSLALSRRFYPHVHNMDGFYVAKIQKLSNGRKAGKIDKEQTEPGSAGDILDQNDQADVDTTAESKEESATTKKKRRSSADRKTPNAKKPKAARSAKISAPPKPEATKKKRKQNAKTLKPRRIKKSKESN